MGTLDIVMNIGLSILSTGIWAFLGLFLFRKEKRSKMNIAYFNLFTGMDRLFDVLNEVKSLLEKPTKDKDIFFELLKQNEIELERKVDAINIDWIISNLPYKSNDGNIIWLFDINYIIGNCRELVSELCILSICVKNNSPDKKDHIDSICETIKEIIPAIEEEIKLIPEKSKVLS